MELSAVVTVLLTDPIKLFLEVGINVDLTAELTAVEVDSLFPGSCSSKANSRLEDEIDICNGSLADSSINSGVGCCSNI